jgi:hypothetical protein
MAGVEPGVDIISEDYGKWWLKRRPISAAVGIRSILFCHFRASTDLDRSCDESTITVSESTLSSTLRVTQ